MPFQKAKVTKASATEVGVVKPDGTSIVVLADGTISTATGGGRAAPLSAGGSYIDAATANTYFLTSPNNAAWQKLSAAEQDVFLAAATSWLETLCWKGTACSDTQALAWPRRIDPKGCCTGATCTTLPAQLVMATAELALALQQNPTAIIGGGGSGGAAGTYVSKQKLGDLDIQYDAFPVSGGVGGAAVKDPLARSPLVIQKFPWLADLLSCFAHVKPGRFIPVERN